MIHQLNIVKKTMKGYKKRLVKGLKSFQKRRKKQEHERKQYKTFSKDEKRR